MKILARVEKTKDFWFLLGTSIIFFFLRLPSLFEPYWYGDEGIYQVLGMGINQGRLLYKDIWDNKPPFLYMLYAVFSSDQFTIRLTFLIIGILSAVVFFLLAKKLFSSAKNQQKIVIVITLLFILLFGLPIIEGNIANSENIMLLPILGAAYLIFKKAVSPTKFSLFIAGVLLSIAFLFKIVAIFDFLAFFLFLIFIHYQKMKNIKTLILKLMLFWSGFIIPILATAIFFLAKGAFFDFLKATLSQNIGYVDYGNRLIIPQGLLVIKLIVLTLACAFLFIKRGSLKTSTIFIFLWFFFSLFNAFFSQRPYTHYLLVLLPSFCLMLGLIFWDKKQQKVTSIITILAFILVLINFTFYGKTITYYQNFFEFIGSKKSVVDYRRFFDRNTPKDYQLAEFLRIHTNSEDNIFIWGNSAQIYKLVNKLPPGRYTVAYHMSASKQTLMETQDSLFAAKPKYIVVSDSKNGIPYILSDYRPRIIIDNSIIYERIF